MNNLEISLLFLFILFLILFYISNFVYNKYLIQSSQEPFSGILKQSDLDAAKAEKQRIQQKLQGLENDLIGFTHQVNLEKQRNKGNQQALTALDEHRKLYYGEFNNQINLIRGLLNSQNSNLAAITDSYQSNMATFETFTNNANDFNTKLQELQEIDTENQEKLNTLITRINDVDDLITTFDINDKNIYSPAPATYQEDDIQEDDIQQNEYTPTNTQPLPPIIVDHSQKQLSANARAAIQYASADDAKYAAELAAQEDKRKVELYDQINNAWNAADNTSVPRRKGYSPSYSNNNINNYDDYVKNTNVGNFVIKDNNNHELRETNSGWDNRPNNLKKKEWKSVFKKHLPMYSDKLPSNWNKMKKDTDQNSYREKLNSGVLADGSFYGRMKSVGRHHAHELRMNHNHFAHNTWHPTWKRGLYPYKYNCDTKYYKSATPEKPSRQDPEYRQKKRYYDNYVRNHPFVLSDDITYGSEKAYELCRSQ